MINPADVKLAVLDMANQNRPVATRSILWGRIGEIQAAKRKLDTEFEAWHHKRRLANLQRSDWSTE